jgi:hypothetical protein
LCWNWSLQAQLVDEEPVCAGIGLYKHNWLMRARLCWNLSVQALVVDEKTICAGIVLHKHYWWMKSLSVLEFVFKTNSILHFAVFAFF